MREHNPLKIFFLFPLIFLLLACTAQPAPLSPTVTFEATQIKPTLLAATHQPTETSAVTTTSTPTHTNTPTFDATTTALIAQLVSTVQPRQTTLLSPDRQWEAQVLTYDCAQVAQGEEYESAYDLLKIIHLSDGKTHEVADQLQYCGGLGGFGLAGITWSPNSRFFYFTSAREGVPDGSGGIGWHRPILRFDTTTSSVENMDSGVFSPDGQKIASVETMPNGTVNRCDPKEFIVQTLDGDTLFQSRIEIDQKLCNFGWSSNTAWAASGEELVLLETTCLEPINCQSNLYRVDLQSQEKQALLIAHQPSFQEVLWSEPDRLVLTGMQFDRWCLALSTGRLEECD